MLRKLLVGALGLSLFAAAPALAQKRGPMMSSVDPAKLQSFCQEVRPSLQKEMQLRSEIRSQILSANPSWDIVLEKEIEAAKIRVEVMKKAQSAGIPYGRGFGAIRKSCGW